MEESFAQIAGAAEHSLKEIDVEVTPENAIVGQGLAPTQEAVKACGGNLDKIMQSLGGDIEEIEGGNISIGGKVKRLIKRVGGLNDTIRAGLEEQRTTEGYIPDTVAHVIRQLDDHKNDIGKFSEAINHLTQRSGDKIDAAVASMGITTLNKLASIINRLTSKDRKLMVSQGGALATEKLVDRLTKHREELRNIVNAFIKSFGGDLDALVKAIDGMAEELGKRIHFDDSVIVFFDTLERLKEFISDGSNNSKMYQYLLELNQDIDISSKQNKERFISLVHDLASRAKEMKSMDSFIKTCEAIISTVNKYNDMVKQFRDDVHKSGGSETDTMNELFSVDSSKINIIGLLNPIENLNIALKKIEFFKNIAIFRSNLQQTNKEIVEYSKDYEKSVGKAIGEAISRIQQEYTEVINNINDNKAGMGLEIDMYNEEQAASKKISKEKLKVIYKWQCDARVGLYKTVEAIDLYLLHFTEAVTKNPDALSDLQKLLTATKVIAKWYDNKAGDNLIRVFEMLAKDGTDAFIKDDIIDKEDFVATRYNTAEARASTDLEERLGGDRANKLYERCRRAVEGVVVLKNIISYFITISERYGGFKGEKNIYMAPSNIYKNLVNYIWVSALDTNITGTDILNDNNEIKRIITFKDTEVGIAKIADIDPDTMGINFNKNSIDKLRILKCNSELQRLGELLSVFTPTEFKRLIQFITMLFARLGKTSYILRMLNFGVYDLTLMSDDLVREFVQTMNTLIGEYGGAAPTWRLGIVNGDEFEGVFAPSAGDPFDIITKLASDARRSLRISINGNFNRIVPLDVFKNLLGPNGRSAFFGQLISMSVLNPAEMGRGFLSQLMRGLIGREDASNDAGYAQRLMVVLRYCIVSMLDDYRKKYSSSVFAIDDTYFILTIKAIAGKVMAVAGINSIYKNPSAVHNSITNSPTRLIMGGADDVEIIDDAIELYVRLPLLVEFYRNIFDNGNKAFKDQSEINNLDNEQISMVPEIGNVWSGLLIAIFDKSKHIEAGLYTYDNMRVIVSEINHIYKHYKNATDSAQLVRHVVLELIAEINRRYGVIKRQELMNYYKLLKSTTEERMTVDESNYTNNDLDILNEAFEFEAKAPSDAYTKELQRITKDDTVSIDTKINKLTDYKIIKDFRKRLDDQLSIIGAAEAPRDISLRSRIRFLKKAITMKTSQREKYDMIIKAIEESDSLNQSSNDIFMCFHEFVVMPLRTLQQMHNSLRSFILNMYVTILSMVSNNKNPAGRFEDILKTMGGEPLSTLRDRICMVIAENNTHLTTDGVLRAAPNNILMTALYDVPAGIAVMRPNTDLNELQMMLINLMLQMSMNSGDLVKLDISTTKRILIDISEYQKVCEYLIANVKYMIDRFTGLVPTTLIEKVAKHPEAGIYAIEQSLLFRIFNKQNHGESTRDVLCIDNLYKLMPIVSHMLFDIHMEPQPLMQKMILHDGVIAGTSIGAIMPFLRDSFMQFNKKSGVFTTAFDGGDVQVSNLLFNPSQTASMFDQPMFGLIQEFNIIISQYLNGLYDAQSKKIYTKAYQSFASSALIDTLNGQSIRDFNFKAKATDPNADFKYHCPRIQTVFSSALAYAMKTLINRVHPTTGAKIHEIATIQEVSPYMLEKYRMLIPLYLRICKAFIHRCRMTRKIIGHMTVNTTAGPIVLRPSPEIAMGNCNVRENVEDTAFDFANVYDYLRDYSKVSTFAPLYIDELVNGMSSLINDIETVQKELLESDSTVTLYFDMKKDFTKNYVASNKDLPFAPLSILAMGYPNENGVDDTIPLYNVKNIGTNKFIYGLRTMLVDDFKISSSKVPYLKKLINDFNGYATGSNTIDDKKFNDVLKYVGQANNFIYDFRFYNGAAISHVDPLRAFVGPKSGVPALLTYQESHDQPKAISIIESVNILDSSNTVSEYVKESGGIAIGSMYGIGPMRAADAANPRNGVILVNLFDLNVMPLNVHSLMREIPLANLYNYAMTFDSIINNLMVDKAFSPFVGTLLSKPYATIVSDAMPYVFREIGATDLRFLNDTIVKKMQTRGLNDVAMNARYNTKLTRNLVFLTLVQFAIKKKVKSELEFINTRIVSNTATVSNVITNANTELGETTDNMFEF